MTAGRRVWKTGFPISRVLLASLLVFALFLAPLSFSRGVDASEHHTHSSAGAGNHPGHDNQSNADHGLIHCGSFSCSPSYVAGAATGFASPAFSSSVETVAGEDLLLRSHYLDCDPPVPRGGSSHA